MADFDLGDYLKRSTKDSGVPERLSDRDTILGVVRLLILAKRSAPLLGQMPMTARQQLQFPTSGRQAS